MPNHYHLLTQTPKPNLASGMRQLNGVYAQSFNCRHVRVGHVLQGRYSARLVQADEHLLSVVRYIVRNPVRAGLCDTPGEWPWSSHRATLRNAPAWLDTPALFCHYAPTREAAREHYRTHVAQPDEDAMSRHPLVEGDAGFIASTLAGLEPAPGIPHRYFAGQRPVLGSLLGSSQPEAIAAAHAYGYSLREIARHLGVNASTISRRLRRHTVRRTQTNASTPD